MPDPADGPGEHIAAGPAGSGALVHDPVLEQARIRPTAVALIGPDRSLTFGELREAALSVAARLAEAGVGVGDPVGIVLEKGVDQQVAVFGALLAGAAFVPIDVAAPQARRAGLLARVTTTVVTRSRYTGGLPPGMTVVDVDRPDEPGRAAWAAVPRRGVPDGVANMLFTSGSTGEPKCVVVTHRAIAHALARTRERYPVATGDRSLAVTALHHDMSLFDTFGMLGAGAATVLPDPARDRDAEHWAELVGRHGVTTWTSVPAMLEMLLEHDPAAAAGLRQVFLGGDRIPLGLVDALAAHAPRARVVSVGGPTETTLWNIWFPIAGRDPVWRSVPYGRPLPGNEYHLLDDRLQDTAPGEIGTLYCSGTGVTLGYHADPARTAAAYVPHPRTGTRMFRTGDLGRRLPDGTIEFCGRGDRQLQIGGHRVEPGEIEAVLAGHAGVHHAVVVPGRRDRDGRVRGLVAWIRPESGKAPDPEELTRHAGAALPPHMVPGRVLIRTELPLTRNGKIDHRELERAAADGAAAGPSDTLSAVDAALAARFGGRG
ncbi:amino acid adenylation domain-containing protein [Pseudonocardia sp. NPDC046786]|uniref:amino acid adenylation domain-containing protein n=1 Tax=Pseudonocardia sp. NPDC046786 TaxID=3155471 RepID=UPI0034083BE0